MQRLTNTCSVIQQRSVLFLYSQQDQILNVLRLSSFGCSLLLSAIYLALFSTTGWACLLPAYFSLFQLILSHRILLNQPKSADFFFQPNKQHNHFSLNTTEVVAYILSKFCSGGSFHKICKPAFLQYQYCKSGSSARLLANLEPFFICRNDYAPSIIPRFVRPALHAVLYQTASHVMDGYANPPAPCVGCGVHTSGMIPKALTKSN